MRKTYHLKKRFWNSIGYLTLALIMTGQITAGYFCLLAQVIYLVANILSLIRGFVLKLPTADNVKNIFFTATTVGLILIKLFQSVGYSVI